MTVTAEVDLGTLIQRKPGINGGRPCLAATGFSVQQLSVLFNEGASPDEILDRYPHLDLTRIYAGIAYYLANRAWIDAEIAAESEAYWAEAARRKAAAAASER
jgi:uncharacterized protein (DUF433 family)